MEQVLQRDTSPFADEFLAEAGLLLNHFHVVSRFGELLPDAVKLTEDTHLHLFGGLIGEGNGKDVAIAGGILHQQSDIFGGERKCLAAAGTRLIDS